MDAPGRAPRTTLGEPRDLRRPLTPAPGGKVARRRSQAQKKIRRFRKSRRTRDRVRCDEILEVLEVHITHTFFSHPAAATATASPTVLPSSARSVFHRVAPSVRTQTSFPSLLPSHQTTTPSAPPYVGGVFSVPRPSPLASAASSAGGPPPHRSRQGLSSSSTTKRTRPGRTRAGARRDPPASRPARRWQQSLSSRCRRVRLGDHESSRSGICEIFSPRRVSDARRAPIPARRPAPS